MEHLQYLVDNFSKDQHFLTTTTLNPADRQNYASAIKICDRRVINMLKSHVKNSDATVLFLQVMSYCIESYMSVNLSPLKRVENIWYALFITRMWRYFILKHPKFTLKENFMTANCYSCIEQDAHCLVLILLFLKKINSEYLFIPIYFSSQACEGFYRRLRSFCPTYSMVASCTVKEAINRISKIQLLNEISNDTDFVFPKTSRSVKPSFFNLPSENEILDAILEAKSNAY